MVTISFDPVVLIVGMAIGFFLCLILCVWDWGSR